MEHDQYKEWLQLLLYDELGENEKKLLETHLASCDECKEELEELKRFHSFLAEHPVVETAEGMERVLSDARHQARAAMVLEQMKPTASGKLREFMGGFFAPKLALGFGAVALLAVGVFAGRYWLAPQPAQEPAGTTPAQNVSFVQDESKITNVHFLSSDPAAGEVEFSFDAITPVHIKGNVNDERVQKVLTHALLNEENPGVRLRSVSTLAEQSGNTEMLDKDVKPALIKALKSDENPAVRKEALKALEKFIQDKDVKNAFLYSLMHDKNAGIRIAVINTLDSTRAEGKPFDKDILDVLKDRMHEDDNNYIRIKAKEGVLEGHQ